MGARVRVSDLAGIKKFHSLIRKEGRYSFYVSFSIFPLSNSVRFNVFQGVNRNHELGFSYSVLFGCSRFTGGFYISEFLICLGYTILEIGLKLNR